MGTGEDGAKDLSDGTFEKLDRLVKNEVHHPVAGPLKRKLGTDRMVSFLAVLLQTTLGRFLPWDKATDSWDTLFLADILQYRTS